LVPGTANCPHWNVPTQAPSRQLGQLEQAFGQTPERLLRDKVHQVYAAFFRPCCNLASTGCNALQRIRFEGPATCLCEMHQKRGSGMIDRSSALLPSIWNATVNVALLILPSMVGAAVFMLINRETSRAVSGQTDETRVRYEADCDSR